MQRAHRVRLFKLAESMGMGLAAMGTHPWANYLDQRIIDTEHYNRLREELRWVAQRNNTWSLHVHMGVQGADRAIAVCDHLRGLLPALLAASANSPFLDGQDTGLASVRTEIFTRTFPRCGVHEPFGDYATYADFVDALVRHELDRRVHPALVERSATPHVRDGRAPDLRRADERGRLVRLRGAHRRLHRPDRDGPQRGLAAQAAPPARDRGEPLAGDPLGDGREDDRLGRPGGDLHRGRGRAAGGVDRARPRRARDRRWSCRIATAPSAPATRLESGSSIEQVYRDALAETRRTYVPE